MGNFGVPVALLLLAVIESELVSYCWHCNSEFDDTCRDFFNESNIMEMRKNYKNFIYGNYRTVEESPRNETYEQRCDELFSVYARSVCIKIVYRGMGGHNDTPQVVRDCQRVSEDFRVGSCPEELKNDTSKIIDHCSTCDFEGCNSAKGITFNSLLATASILIIFFL